MKVFVIEDSPCVPGPNEAAALSQHGRRGSAILRPIQKARTIGYAMDKRVGDLPHDALKALVGSRISEFLKDQWRPNEADIEWLRQGVADDKLSPDLRQACALLLDLGKPPASRG